MWHDDVAHIEFKTSPQAIRDLNLWEQPCFWIYQAPFHRCGGVTTGSTLSARSNARTYPTLSLRAVRAPLADRQHGGGGCPSLGISAETVDRMVENQLTEDRQIDPQRVIADIGLDELSLKKRHRLYVTLMTDLSDPTRAQTWRWSVAETRRRR